MLSRRDRSRPLLTFLGIVLLPGSAAILGFNEIRTVRLAGSLGEVAGLVQETRADRLDPALEGKLVHVAGPLQVTGALSDPEFPVTVPGAVQMRRTVQSYHWREEGGGRAGSYSYRAVWTEKPIDSSTFHQRGGAENPPPRYVEQHWLASGATLGVFQVPQGLLRDLRGSRAVTLTDAALRAGMRRDGNTLYVGANPGVPQIGDQRLAWEVVQAAEASVIAQQRGSGLAAYRTAAGDQFQAIRPGLVETSMLLGLEAQDNASVTWMGRIVGAALMFGAFCLLLGPLSLALSVEKLAAGGTAMGAALLSVVGVPLVIGVARLAVEPISGLLAVGVGAGLWLVLSRRLASSQRPAA